MNASNSVKENGRVGSDAGLFGCLMRAIGIFLVVSAAASSSALANLECFEVLNGCGSKSTAVGGFRKVNDVIIIDLVINGKSCADVLGAEVVKFTGSCDDAVVGDTLFSLGQCNDNGDGNARFEGQFTITITTGDCADGDPIACMVAGDALVHKAEQIVHDIIKDNDGSSCVPIPAVSDWGLVTMVGLVMIAGTLVFRRRPLSV